MKIIVHCATCDKEKKIGLYEYKTKNNHFCNRQCYGKWRSENQRGENNPSFVKEKVIIKCEWCGKEKIPSLSKLKRNKIHFCNIECLRKYEKASKIIVYCSNCGKQKEINESNYKLNKTKLFFCDLKCKGKYKTKNGVTTIQCFYCGQDVDITNWRVERTEKMFCDKECYINWQKENESPLKTSVTTFCNWCGVNIDVTQYRLNQNNNLFCSVECFNKFQRGGDGNKIIVQCVFCGKDKEITPFTYNSSESKRFFCSVECQNLWQVDEFKLENNPNWKGGISFELYSQEFNNELKEKIRDRDNRTCQICGLKEEDNCRSLDIHHINYDKLNNNPINLISLCATNGCHMKTNGNRDYWERRLSHLIKLKYPNYFL